MIQVKDLMSILAKADPDAFVAVESSTFKMITTSVKIEYSTSNYYHPDNVDGEYPDAETYPEPEFFVIREA